MKEKNARIIIVEHSVKGTLKILCAAFHLDMLTEKGYVWFVRDWLGKRFTTSVPSECSVNDVKKLITFSFALELAGAYVRSRIVAPSNDNYTFIPSSMFSFCICHHICFFLK